MFLCMVLKLLRVCHRFKDIESEKAAVQMRLAGFTQSYSLPYVKFDVINIQVLKNDWK